ncbi:MAG: hypothetical protein LUD39_03160 [Opitutae bacterium]|nr:hypothetical protein [Opitutae bacterium]
MKKSFFFPFVAIFCAFGGISAFGSVAVTTPELQQNAFIIRVDAPAQEFYFRDARKITNLSLQKYVSAQATEVSSGAVSAQYVTEMSFDLRDSPLVVRIYAMEIFDPTRIQTSETARKIRTTTRNAVNSLTNTNVMTVADYLVFKTYPQTTHAKTIEIRLATADEVEEFYSVFKDYMNRERSDYQYYGAIKSPNSKLTDTKLWLGINNVKSPARDWADACDKKKVVLRGSSSTYLVSGLSGLCFTVGVSTTVAEEIEEKDVSEE